MVQMSHWEAVKFALLPGRIEAFEKMCAKPKEKEFASVSRLAYLGRGLRVLRDRVYVASALSAIALLATGLSLWTMGAFVLTFIAATALYTPMVGMQFMMNSKTAPPGGYVIKGLPIFQEKEYPL